MVEESGLLAPLWDTQLQGSWVLGASLCLSHPRVSLCQQLITSTQTGMTELLFMLSSNRFTLFCIQSNRKTPLCSQDVNTRGRRFPQGESQTPKDSLCKWIGQNAGMWGLGSNHCPIPSFLLLFLHLCYHFLKLLSGGEKWESVSLQDSRWATILFQGWQAPFFSLVGFCLFVVFFLAGLGIKPRALRILGNCSATKLHLQP